MPDTLKRKRRERDRPKAPPNALYNPNKRVLLAYDSDNDAEAHGDMISEGVKTDPAVAETLADVDDALRAAVDAPCEEVQSGELPAEASDGSANDVPTKSESKPATAPKQFRDYTTGQWTALGSYPEHDEDGEAAGAEESTPDPAMEYLRAVRSERETLPAVLCASTPAYQGAATDRRVAFDNDEAYVDTSTASITTATELEDDVDPREAFTATLKKRFLRQRHQLHLPSSDAAIAALREDNPIDYPKSNNKATVRWLHLLRTTAPLPAQVRSLGESIVFRLLALIQDHFLQREKDVNPITSAWLFALLARLNEVGMMNNDQVYAVRAVGKKAVLVLVSFRSADTAAQLEDYVDAHRSVASSTPSANASKAGAAGNEDSKDIMPATRENTLATLDSILVIAGDIFGQRDLLEYRQPWTKDTV